MVVLFWLEAVHCSIILCLDHFSGFCVVRICLQVQHFNVVDGIHDLFALSFEEFYVTHVLKVAQGLISFTWVVWRSVMSPKIEVRDAGIGRNIQTSMMMMFSLRLHHSLFVPD